VRDRRGITRSRVVAAVPQVPELAPGTRAVVLVEGVSDSVAVEAAARRLGVDLAGVQVVAAGGIGSIGALAERFGPKGAGLPLRGLCDAAEVPWLCKALTKAGVGIALDPGGLEALGFAVCDRDLEDELIRALGVERVEALFAAEGDLAAFRTLQRQGPWRDAAVTDQIRRFLGAGAGRKIRYAGVFVQAVALERMPEPLRRLLAGLQPDPRVV
jgi:hypothetical protein